jgi:ASC-1-like (ASCH) protein
MLEIGIKTDSFQSIRDEKKTIEGRLAKPRFLTIAVGDEILVREDVWENGKPVGSRPNRLIITVTQLDQFSTFREMLEKLGFEKFRPEDSSLEQALETYRVFYTEAEEREYGVLAISFQLKNEAM